MGKLVREHRINIGIRVDMDFTGLGVVIAVHIVWEGVVKYSVYTDF